MSSNIFKIIDLYERINSDLEYIEDDNYNDINNFAIPILNIINNVMNENNNIKEQEQEKNIIEEDYKINEMTIIYNINKNDDKINLFDNICVENNKDKCHLIIDDKKCEL